MRNNLLSALAIFLLIFTSCSGNNMQVSSAAIIERKMMTNGKLMLSYVFKAGGKTITDSLVTENKVIPGDTLKVTFPVTNPKAGKALLP